MGRAYEVRKASIQKNGAKKANLFSTCAKEIYLAAKGNPDMESNITLKRVVEKYKGKQVPMDIINRAIDKAKGNDDTNYQENIYEGFGPGNSTFMIVTLTDNVNRTVAFVREVFNKIHKSMGVTNSVSYNYKHEALLGFESTNGDEIMLSLLDSGIEVIDFEDDNNEILITLKPGDESKCKDIIEAIEKDVKYTIDEIGWYPNEKITLSGEDLETFNKALSMFEAIDDVVDVYHNVEI